MRICFSLHQLSVTTVWKWDKHDEREGRRQARILAEGRPFFCKFTCKRVSAFQAGQWDAYSSMVITVAWCCEKYLPPLRYKCAAIHSACVDVIEEHAPSNCYQIEVHVPDLHWVHTTPKYQCCEQIYCRASGKRMGGAYPSKTLNSLKAFSKTFFKARWGRGG